MTNHPTTASAPTPPGAIVVCQMEVIPGNPEVNLARILRGIDEVRMEAQRLELLRRRIEVIQGKLP